VLIYSSSKERKKHISEIRLSIICQEKTMKNDDKIRSETGLAVCLRDMGNGKSRIFIDDVMADIKQNPINWSYNCFYTF
jgi:hypothetical protein